MDNNNHPITHPTQYSSLSDIEVKALFTSSNWNNLSPESKLDACQEIENRLATERGFDSRLVYSSPMEGKTYGFQSGNSIALNSHLLETGAFVVQHKDFEGKTQNAIVPVDAPSWEILSTLYHEDTHGLWEDKGIMPRTYIQPETSNLLYYLQSSEKAAFLNEEKLTLETIKSVAQYNKEMDPQALVYMEAHSGNTYQQVLEKAQKLYNDPNIEQTLNLYIANTDKGIIPPNPSQSYIRIDDLYIKQNIRNYFGNQPFKENELNVTQQQNRNLTNHENMVNVQNNAMEATQTSITAIQTAEQNNTPQTTNSVQSASTIINDGSTISNTNTLGVSSIENDGSVIDSGYSIETGNDGYSSTASGYSSGASDGQSGSVGQTNDSGQSNSGGQSNDGGQSRD